MDSSHYPEPTVGALIVNPDGDILLLESPKWSNKFIIPGGHIKIGEKAIDALRREIYEETALEIFDIEFLGYQDCIFPESFVTQRHFLFLDFTCRSEGKQVVTNEEAIDHIWVSPKRALSMNVVKNTKVTIQKFLDKKEIKTQQICRSDRE